MSCRLLEDRRGDVVIDSQGKQVKGASNRAIARGIHPQGITKYMVVLNENKHAP